MTNTSANTKRIARNTLVLYARMTAFAYISILEVVGKLAIAFLIVISPIDKLIFYAILMCVVALLVRLAYGIYCKQHFEECTYHFIFDKDLLKRMFGFAGWNFIGASSAVLRDQGGNVVINLFCGPTVNAARGIAFQVNTAIISFVGNFMTALNPQITKSYASGDRDYMMMNLPVSYFLLRMGMFPEVVIVVAIVISQCCLAARLVMLRGMIGLSVRKYLRKVYANVLAVTVIASVLPFFMAIKLEESFLNFVLSSLVSLLCAGTTIYYIGCNKTERQFVMNKLYAIKNRLNRK